MVGHVSVNGKGFPNITPSFQLVVLSTSPFAPSMISRPGSLRAIRRAGSNSQVLSVNGIQQFTYQGRRIAISGHWVEIRDIPSRIYNSTRITNNTRCPSRIEVGARGTPFWEIVLREKEPGRPSTLMEASSHTLR